ncbi:MarR family winged helix-turn-helix transcriptional regulator [Achromobacter spanius]|uniref:MarR family winged helix-turn-helix transcriptional regulator n=1 Tax=Achromobacter spanius TaxID=217203 RepID=UPI003209D9EA
MSRSRTSSLPEFPADVAALTELTLTVFRTHGALLQWGDKLVEPLGLTSARWQMLGALALAGQPLTAPQVGQAMGVTRQGAQKQLNLLAETGLVSSQANPAHRRSPLYALTPRGRQLYLKAEKLWAAEAAQLASRVSPAQVRTAQATLDAMQGHLNPAPPLEPS